MNTKYELIILSLYINAYFILVFLKQLKTKCTERRGCQKIYTSSYRLHSGKLHTLYKTKVFDRLII